MSDIVDTKRWDAEVSSIVKGSLSEENDNNESGQPLPEMTAA